MATFAKLCYSFAMKTAYTHRASNNFKTALLMAIFFAVIIAIGYFVSEYYGSRLILYGALIFSIFMNFLSYYFSDKIVLAMSNAKEANRSEYFDFYTLAENLSISSGLPMPRLYVIQDDAPNAFATGRNKNHSVVAVTTGLLNSLNRKELEGVLAHEFSHIGNKDILLMSSVVVLVGFVSIIADMFLHGFAFRNSDEGDNRSGALAIIGIVLMILSPMIATLIQLAISRRREYLADASGALLTRYPEGLASALRKIANHNTPMKNPHRATAHMFISNPFGGGKMGERVAGLFATHPPTEKRIAALNEMGN